MSCKEISPALRIDQALLNVTVTASKYGFQLWTQSAECDKCSLVYQTSISANSSHTLKVDSAFETVLRLIKDDGTNDSFCKKIFKFGEWGKYHLEVYPSGIHEDPCFIHSVVDPVDSNLNVLWAFLLLFGLSVFWIVGKVLYRRGFQTTAEDDHLLVSDLGSPSERRPENQIWSFSVESHNLRLRERLRSLDTFRGLCISMMIFVNYGGGQYWYFQHSKWNGLTVADLVFPWFMWIMGVSIPLNIRSKLRRAVPKKKLFFAILKRSAILFTLGLMLNSKYDPGCNLADFRIMGVLQRLAVSYLIVATLHLLTENLGDAFQIDRWASMRDIFPYWLHWIVISCVVALHCSLTFSLPVPGCPTGYLGPGGLHDNSSHVNCTGGVAGYVDRLILGANHMYKHASCQKMYQTQVPFDPEGVFGCLSSLLSVFLGLQAGKIIALYPLFPSRVKRWLVWAALSGIPAAILCKASENDGWIPVNKNLWYATTFLLLF
ncbi:hypothetical protein CHUAL_000491 [Chamberlinius hualienensis]